MKTVLIVVAGLALAVLALFAFTLIGAPSDSARAAQASADAAQVAAQAAQDAHIAQVTADASQRWDYSATKNEMAGGLDRLAIIGSTNAVNFDPPYEGEQHAFLAVRKTADSSEYEVVLSVERGQLLDGDQAGVEVKLDDAAPIRFGAHHPDDNDSTRVFFDDVLADDQPDSLHMFLGRAQHAKTMKVQVTAYQNGSPVFTFNIAGFDLAKLESAQ